MTTPSEKLREVERRYAPGEERPLGGYVRSLATFAAVVGGLASLVARRGGPPDDISTRDIVLASVATFRGARSLAEASVTSPLRAPFTRFAGPAAPGEVQEEVQEDAGGHRHAVGELVSCPYCLGTWVATGFGFGLALAPRWTRLAATILAANAGSDVMQKLYSDLQAR